MLASYNLNIFCHITVFVKIFLKQFFFFYVPDRFREIHPNAFISKPS